MAPNAVPGVLDRAHQAEAHRAGLDLDPEQPRRFQVEGRLIALQPDLGPVGEHGRGDEAVAGPGDGERYPLPGTCPEVGGELVPAVEMAPVDGDDAVPRLQAGPLGRAGAAGKGLDGGHRAVRGRVGDEIADVPGAQEQHHEHQEGQDKMHERTGAGHGQPAPRRLVAIGARLVGRVHLLDVGHTDYPAVPSQRQRLDAVGRLTPAHGPQPGPEPDEELAHLHARPLGRYEVPQLVQDDDDQKGDDHQDGGQRPEQLRHNEPGDHDDGQAHQSTSLLAGRWVPGPPPRGGQPRTGRAVARGAPPGAPPRQRCSRPLGASFSVGGQDIVQVAWLGGGEPLHHPFDHRRYIGPSQAPV